MKKQISIALGVLVVTTLAFGMGSWFPKKPVQVQKPVEVKPVEPPKQEVTSQPVENHTGEASKPIGEEYPIGGAKKVFTAKISDTNYTAAQKAKVAEAERKIIAVVNSDKFKQKVLDFTYNGKKEFVDNNGLSNAEIYEKVFNGAEALQPALNYQMDITLTMYKSMTSTVGYTYPSVLKVWTNSKYHNSFSACDVVGNVFHEWVHKLGFSHADSHNKSRPYSVPYGLGYLVADLCREL